MTPPHNQEIYSGLSLFPLVQEGVFILSMYYEARRLENLYSILTYSNF